MDPIKLLLIILGACIVFWIIVLLVIKHIKKKNKGIAKVENVKKNAKISEDENITNTDDSPNVTLNNGDLILAMNTTYTVGKKSGIKEGKYTVLSSIETLETFNIRLNGFVRPFKHGTDIVLEKDATICPVSCTIILR